MVLFPRNQKKPKAGDASAASLKEVQQLTGAVLPFKPNANKREERKITEEEKKQSAFWQLRRARADARLDGYRKKKALEAEEAKK